MSITIGSSVEFADPASGRIDAFMLVAADYASVPEGRLSVRSPVARALLGHQAGDIVSVKLPHGQRQLRVLSVR